jgi:pyrroline-5-carboxylate reductase
VKHLQLTIIGGGNMGRALAGGLLRSGTRPESVQVCESSPEARARLHADLGLSATSDPAAAIADANVVLLAVKPQDLRAVVELLRPALQNTYPLVLSIAAGVRIAALRDWCGAGVPIARAMPNRPALLGAGATGIYAEHDVPSSSRALAERILKAVGAVVWVESESALDIVTALSGSGPAYFFLLADAMRQSAVDLGLDPHAARLLAMETLYGAGLQAHDSDGDLVHLRDEVTSKGGTTEAAIRSLMHAEFSATIHAALQAATRRSRELAAQFGSFQETQV